MYHVLKLNKHTEKKKQTQVDKRTEVHYTDLTLNNQVNEMRTREKLMLQYKDAKANGTTTATSFKQYQEELANAKTVEIQTVLLTVDDSIKLLTHQKAVKAVNKAEKAKELYLKLLDSNVKLTRKEILAKFVEEIGLTVNGANTYLYNIQKSLK